MWPIFMLNIFFFFFKHQISSQNRDNNIPVTTGYLYIPVTTGYLYLPVTTGYLCITVITGGSHIPITMGNLYIPVTVRKLYIPVTMRKFSIPVITGKFKISNWILFIHNLNYISGLANKTFVTKFYLNKEKCVGKFWMKQLLWDRNISISIMSDKRFAKWIKDFKKNTTSVS